jgi:hypothetical protein
MPRRNRNHRDSRGRQAVSLQRGLAHDNVVDPQRDSPDRA